MKRDEEKKKTAFWTRVMLVLIAVLFVGMMIISSWGMGWITSFRTVKPLDSLSLLYTIRDDNGQVILTTDREVYQTAVRSGDPVFYTTPLDIQAGKTGNPVIMDIPAYNQYLGEVKFALLGLEADEMAVALLGLHAGETRRLTFQFEDPLQSNFSVEEFNMVGGNFSTSVVGDWIPLGFSKTPVVDFPGQNETASDTVLRMARILDKTDTGALLDYRYGTAEVSFEQFSQ